MQSTASKTVLGTRIDPGSESFRRNREKNLELVNQLTATGGSF